MVEESVENFNDSNSDRQLTREDVFQGCSAAKGKEVANCPNKCWKCIES